MVLHQQIQMFKFGVCLCANNYVYKNNDLEKVIPENITDTGYLYNPIVQRKFGFDGFKNLTVGQSITIAHIDERLKPAFTHTWKVNGGANRY